MRTALITGSSGLIGSEIVGHLARVGHAVRGVDNNQRAVFFGAAGDTRWNQARLERQVASFVHHEVDIRDRSGILSLVQEIRHRPGLALPNGELTA